MLTHCQACYFDTNFLHFVYYEPLWGKQYTELQYIKLQFLTNLMKMQQSGWSFTKRVIFCPALFILVNQRGGRRSIFKNKLSGIIQFLATDNTLKLMKNAFYFNLKALFVLKKSKFSFWFFGHIEKWLD